MDTVAWVKPPEPIRGLDHLGVQAPCIALYGQLLPCITNVTVRARYYSFHPWVVWAFERRYADHSVDEFRRVLRRAECSSRSSRSVTLASWLTATTGCTAALWSAATSCCASRSGTCSNRPRSPSAGPRRSRAEGQRSCLARHRVARGREQADQVHADDAPSSDEQEADRLHAQGALAHRARLRGAQDRARPRSLRGSLIPGLEPPRLRRPLLLRVRRRRTDAAFSPSAARGSPARSVESAA